MSNIKKRELVVPWSMEPTKERDEAAPGGIVESVSTWSFERRRSGGAAEGAVVAIFAARLIGEVNW